MDNVEMLKEAIALVPEFAHWGEPVHDPVLQLFRIPVPDKSRGTSYVIVNDTAFYKRSAAVLARCLSNTYLEGTRGCRKQKSTKR